MFHLYSLLYTAAFILMTPLFLLRRDKYAAGFSQRLGNLPVFEKEGRHVVWLHCVSVGEANAARPLVTAIHDKYPDHRLIVSTTTRTGQELARDIFRNTAEAVFYFPFDWKFSVRRALRNFEPNSILLMETEVWFNFFQESRNSGARLAIVNGRLSEKSFMRYSYIKNFMQRVLGKADLSLMQDAADAGRIISLGADPDTVKVTGNLKFDQSAEDADPDITESIRDRFDISGHAPLIVAASTHAPEEKWILEAFKEAWKNSNANLPRLLIAPRHPERFGEVADLIKKTGFTWVRYSETQSGRDQTAEIILLDTIGELRSAYPLAEIVFVGGSLIPHGGQSVLEPAAAGKAIITGPHTHNFDAVVKEFLDNEAIVQLPEMREDEVVEKVAGAITGLLHDQQKREQLAGEALAVMKKNRGATSKTVEFLKPILDSPESQ